MRKVLLLVGLCCLVGATTRTVWAATITGNMTVDNCFTAYISTSDVWGVGTWNVIASAPKDDYWAWLGNYALTPTVLTPGVKQYLNIEAVDWGGGAGLIGTFSLSDDDFHFANGSQTLITSIADWKVSASGFDGVYAETVTVCNFLPDAHGWHVLESTDAKWIWTNYGGDIGNWVVGEPYDDTTGLQRYFSTEIGPAPSVPEPASLLLALPGLAGVDLIRRRK
jgi:hypothetical protein